MNPRPTYQEQERQCFRRESPPFLEVLLLGGTQVAQDLVQNDAIGIDAQQVRHQCGSRTHTSKPGGQVRCC